MRVNYYGKRFFTIFSFVLLFSWVLSFVLAQDIQKQIKQGLDLTSEELLWLRDNSSITLAVDDKYPPKNFRASNGEIKGISIDYMHLLAELIGIDIVFEGSLWSEALDKALQHKVDGIINADVVPDRLPYLNFTEVYSTFPLAVVVRSDSSINDFADCIGKRIAVNKNTSQAHLLKTQYPEVVVVEVSDSFEQFNLLANNKVDGAFDELVVLNQVIAENYYTDVKVAFVHYDPLVGQSRIGLRKDSAELLSIFNKAIAALTVEDHNRIQNKWLGASLSPLNMPEVHVALSAKERRWLAENRIIKVAADPLWKPIEFKNNKGEFKGISIEFFNALEKSLGVKFEIVDVEDWSEAVDKVRNKEAHMFSAVIETPERLQYLDFTLPYLSFPMVIYAREDVPYVVKIDSLATKKIAVIKGYASTEIMKKNHPLLDYVECENLIEALKKVQRREVFGCIANLASGTQYIKELGYYDIKVVGETPYSFDLAMAVHKDFSLLRGILQKALDNMSEEEINLVYSKWIALGYEHGFNYGLLWKVLFVVALFFAFFVYWNIGLRREVKKRKLIENELRLSKDGLEILVSDRTKELLSTNEKLRLSNERYEQVAALSSDVIWELDILGHYTYISPKCLDVFGYKQTEMLGAAFFDFLVQNESQRNKELYRRVITNAEYLSSYEATVLHRDGSKVIVQVWGMPLYDLSGVVAGYRGVARDVTELKQTEELIIQNEKMSSIGGLAAGMAHELNNPLGAILQGIQNFERRLFGDLAVNKKVAKECGLNWDVLQLYIEKRGLCAIFEAIKSSGERASVIINNMLGFSRKAGGIKELSCVDDLIECSIDLAGSDYDLGQSYDFKDIVIFRDYEHGLPRIRCCIVEIEQVLLNLLKNSAQAMHEKCVEAPEIHIRTSIEGKYVCIEVSDNGPGIEESVRKRIFEPFFTTKDVGKGTGLGLSVAYMIITQNHKGIMEVVSDHGHGTKFKIRLPF